jgi:hypothetical protein
LHAYYSYFLELKMYSISCTTGMYCVCVSQEAGLREGDYIVAVDGENCKWAKHGEVVHSLKSCSDRGVELSVITLHTHDTQVVFCVCVRVICLCVCITVSACVFECFGASVMCVVCVLFRWRGGQ